MFCYCPVFVFKAIFVWFLDLILSLTNHQLLWSGKCWSVWFEKLVVGNGNRIERVRCTHINKKRETGLWIAGVYWVRRSDVLWCERGPKERVRGAGERAKERLVFSRAQINIARRPSNVECIFYCLAPTGLPINSSKSDVPDLYYFVSQTV